MNRLSLAASLFICYIVVCSVSSLQPLRVEAPIDLEKVTDRLPRQAYAGRKKSCIFMSKEDKQEPFFAQTQQQERREPVEIREKVENRETVDTTYEEEALSDVDTRVLREMLQDSKLDLETEEDVRKLLERGTRKTAVSSDNFDTSNEDSEYDSKVLQKLSDTKLWKAVSAKTSDIFESAKLWISNKVERDIKTLAALGIFAWDRVVRDVARALPAAATLEKKTLFLTNTSSFEEQPRPTAESLRNELNRPSDEIKSVSQDIWDILSGKATEGTEGRGLRTVAKAGTANIADRQRRAYQQTKKKREEETGVKGIRKIPGGIIDATYELQRELKSETSTAGYKTKPIRKAIEAGVVGTGKYLQGIQDAARLAAAERKAKRLEATTSASVPTDRDNTPTGGIEDIEEVAPEISELEDPTASPSSFESKKEELLVELRNERIAMLERLLSCIRHPESTWLQSQFLTDEARALSQDSLREVATLIILLKDELSEQTIVLEESSLESLVGQLRTDLRFVEEVRDTVVDTVSELIGNTLFDIVVGSYDAEEHEIPILLRLDEIDDIFLNPINSSSPTSEAVPEPPESEVWRNADVIDTEDLATAKEAEVVVSPTVVDVVTESVVTDDIFVETEGEAVVGEVISDSVVVPELVSDDAFEEAVGVRQVESIDMEEDEVEAERPFILTAVLRSLDVAFFVLEKIFIVAIPRSASFASTAASRINEVNQGGKGKKGWESIRNTADPKGRY